MKIAEHRYNTGTYSPPELTDRYEEDDNKFLGDGRRVELVYFLLQLERPRLPLHLLRIQSLFLANYS